MPEIIGRYDYQRVVDNHQAGALPIDFYPADIMCEDVVTIFVGGEYSLDKVRFLGYHEYGSGAENVPAVLLTVTLFYKDGMTGDYLNAWAVCLAEKASKEFNNLHVIVKIHAGNLNGFGEANKPEE